jgi:hypothetical protein
VKGLTLANGRVIGANGANGNPPAPGQDAFGAGILDLGGTVTLTDCTLTNHFVQGGNAGQDLSNPSGNTGKGGDGLGAAIYGLGGALNLTNCLLISNVSTGGLGSASNPQLFLGTSGSAAGGAIFSQSSALTLEAVTLTNNAALGE